MAGLLIAIFSMPFLKGQTLGFLAGIALVAFFTACYGILKAVNKRKAMQGEELPKGTLKHRRILTEFSEELHPDEEKKQ